MKLFYKLTILLCLGFGIVSLPVYSQTLIKCCNCNNTIDSKATGFGEDHSKPRLCDQCKAKRCKQIAESRKVIDKIIPFSTQKSFSPTEAQWKILFQLI